MAKNTIRQNTKVRITLYISANKSKFENRSYPEIEKLIRDEFGILAPRTFLRPLLKEVGITLPGLAMEEDDA